MKTTTIPSLRVSPQLRKSAERVLAKGETLSAFVEQAIAAQVAHRQLRQEFIHQGLQSGGDARLIGTYIEAEQVVARLEGMLSAAKASYGKKQRHRPLY